MKSGNGDGAATLGVNFVPAGAPMKIKIFSELAIMHVIQNCQNHCTGTLVLGC